MTNMDVREVIDAYTDDACLYPDKTCEFCKGYFCVSEEDAYKCLMKRLGELGLVKRVDRELPDNGLWTPRGWITKAEVQAIMDLAVEPLIKEK